MVVDHVAPRLHGHDEGELVDLGQLLRRVEHRGARLGAQGVARAGEQDGQRDREGRLDHPGASGVEKPDVADLRLVTPRRI